MSTRTALTQIRSSGFTRRRGRSHKLPGTHGAVALKCLAMRRMELGCPATDARRTSRAQNDGAIIKRRFRQKHSDELELDKR